MHGIERGPHLRDGRGIGGRGTEAANPTCTHSHEGQAFAPTHGRQGLKVAQQAFLEARAMLDAAPQRLLMTQISP